MQSHEFFYTVFTPTFNRAHTLHRVYESLKKQTCSDFEWLIIDDGSTDNTEQLISEWQKEASFSIRYIWQTNRGHGHTTDEAVKIAKGFIFFRLDSDDGCFPRALENVKRYWDAIPEEQKPFYVGICGLCEDEHGKMIGDRFPQDTSDMNWLELKYKFKIKGERCQFFILDILKKYPYPKTLGNYFPPGINWSRIARHYKLRCVNEVFRIYYQDLNGKTDRIMKAKPQKVAAGISYWQQSKLNEDIDWFKFAPIEFLRSSVHYSRFLFHQKKSLTEQYRGLTNGLAKLLWLFTLPIGFLVFCKDRFKYQNS